MARQGFIFSLDAFVAFTLTMVTISLLIFIIGMPKPFFTSLEQASKLAQDTLQVMAASKFESSGRSYLETALSASDTERNKAMNQTAGGIIPPGYGYRLESFNFTSQNWSKVFDSSDASSRSGREGRNFTKLRASSTIFSSLYEIDPLPGKSPYCYLSCNGYNPANPGNPPSPCNVTPCDSPISNFQAGKNMVRLVRLTVYT